MSKISGKFKVALMDLLSQYKVHEYTQTPNDIMCGNLCMHLDNMQMFNQMRDTWYEAVREEASPIIMPDEKKLVVAP